MESDSLLQVEYEAYIPCYDNGNCVMMIKKDGQAIVINKGIKPVISSLLKESSLDIKALRKNFSGSSGRINQMPLPLRLGRVLIPIKVRKTIGVHDGAFAYIDLSSIETVSGDKKAVIMLNSGRKINCLESVRTVKKRMQLGGLIRGNFASRMSGELAINGGHADALEYSKPATREDISMLAYEIMKMIKMIEKS